MTEPKTTRSGGAPLGGTPSLHLGIFLVSLSVLAMQILQTRLFSLMLWHHVTYFVVTITLLGFAASGTALAIFPGLSRGRVRDKAALYAVLFALSTLGALRLLAFLKPETLGDRAGSVEILELFTSYFYLVVPYLFAGLSIGVLLKELAGRVGPLYAANLAGSGAGCFFFVLAITPLGGAGTTLATALAACLGALALAWDGGMRPTRLFALAMTGLLALLLPASLVWPERVLPIPAAGSKLMTKELAVAGSSVEKTLWSPLCRIDVVPAGPEEKRVYQDGDAPTTIWSGRKALENVRTGLYERFFYGLAYLTRRGSNPAVLIIGPGGGIDVEHALYFGARSVAAVEINSVMLEMARRDYRDFSARERGYGVYEAPAVTPIASEGRAWLRRSSAAFDVIQMTGTDTYAALASGAHVFSESYLYTVEAFQEYLDRLTPDGVTAILRFRFEPPRESLKLAAIASRALKSRGVADPGAHLLVINITQPLSHEHQALFGIERIRYAVTLMKRCPWTAEEVDIYRRWREQANQDLTDPVKSLGFYASAGFVPAVGGKEAAGDREYLDFFAAAQAGTEKEFFGSYTYDVSPATDDRPFFFKFHRWSDVLRSPGAGEKIDYEALAGRDPIGLRILLSLLLFVTLAVLLIVLLPLLFLGRRGRVPQKMRVFVYFFGIGLGFIFAEIASLQRFVLFLGHPTYSLTVVLFGFLFFMGLGSLATRKLALLSRLPTRLALGGVIAFLLLHGLFLPDVFRACLHLPEAGRMAIAALCIAPLAFLMGFAFPTGMGITSRVAPGLVPWAWGVNGAASVTGSVLAILLAMAGGFTLVLALAAAAYLAALLLVPDPKGT